MKLVRNALLVSILAILPIGSVWAETAADVDSVIKKAEVARQRVAAVNGEWRDTEKLIQQAKSEVQEGKLTNALTLANQAYHQGELSYQQAMKQKDLDFPTYLR
jgi:chitodextrinase